MNIGFGCPLKLDGAYFVNTYGIMLGTSLIAQHMENLGPLLFARVTKAISFVY